MAQIFAELSKEGVLIVGMLTILVVVGIFLCFEIILLHNKYNKLMATFEEMQATIDATNIALGNIQTDVDGFKTRIKELEDQVANMGLTAEQEGVINAGLADLKARAESISSAIEGENEEE